MWWQLGHSKESNSNPVASGSIPNSLMCVLHFGQSGRAMESECGVAGW
jgi:hypothetical protein